MDTQGVRGGPSEPCGTPFSTWVGGGSRALGCPVRGTGMGTLVAHLGSLAQLLGPIAAGTSSGFPRSGTSGPEAPARWVHTCWVVSPQVGQLPSPLHKAGAHCRKADGGFPQAEHGALAPRGLLSAHGVHGALDADTCCPDQAGRGCLRFPELGKCEHWVLAP